MRLALKVDVDTLRGTRRGVPALLAALGEAGAGATFLFSLGPDHTGRVIRRVFRPGFLDKQMRTSAVATYGLKTLLYGTLLPGPDIGRRAGDVMRRVRDAGFEVGIHCFDHVTWQDFVTRRGPEWTARQIDLAVERFEAVFDQRPRVHGAAGWQMNEAALCHEEQLGFTYASDTRGQFPFVPLITGRRGTCPQLPTTLPTLDELIGVDGTTPENVHEVLLGLTRVPPPDGHVFTLHAELEGMALLPVLRRLLAGWRAQGYQLVSMATLYAALDIANLPGCVIAPGTVPGRSGELACQVASA